MECSRCGTPNEAGRKFCSECGLALSIVCPVCGTSNSPGSKFCGECGARLAEAPAAAGSGAASEPVTDQRLVTGDLVNTASRLQSAAEPGSVLAGERTYRAASRAICFAPVEPLTLKGKPDPVSAWRAVRVVSERGGSMRGEAPEPPFVGR